MKRNRIPSFRGLRATIEHQPGADRTMLQSQLERLGLVVAAGHDSDRCVDPAPDVFFFDGDGIDGHCQPDAATLPRDIPLIALIGSEAPGRLEALFTLRPSAYLTKPIRRTGVYSCLAIAMLHHGLLRHMNERLFAAEQRISQRRKVISAVVKLMQCEALSEDAAYRTLQRAAMSRRQSIEALSIDLVTGRRAVTDVLAGIEGGRRSELG
jgi:AmiR/NasT family two-component response regulator